MYSLTWVYSLLDKNKKKNRHVEIISQLIHLERYLELFFCSLCTPLLPSFFYFFLSIQFQSLIFYFFFCSHANILTSHYSPATFTTHPLPHLLSWNERKKKKNERIEKYVGSGEYYNLWLDFFFKSILWWTGLGEGNEE